jgi:hypothetical protein
MFPDGDVVVCSLHLRKPVYILPSVMSSGIMSLICSMFEKNNLAYFGTLLGMLECCLYEVHQVGAYLVVEELEMMFHAPVGNVVYFFVEGCHHVWIFVEFCCILLECLILVLKMLIEE